MEQILRIADFILKSFLHIWPYLLVTIPLSVIINLSGASKYITKAFGKNPVISVFLATCIGAFSPFCSCGVIPVISSLLLGGVPLAPVMSFWIASPSMDPEIFFLSSSVLGIKLAIWRLASTFLMSLLAGYITHFAVLHGFTGSNPLRFSDPEKQKFSIKALVSPFIPDLLKKRKRAGFIPAGTSINCCIEPVRVNDDSSGCSCSSSSEVKHQPAWIEVYWEIKKSTLLVAKFMGLAFLITALINFYLPENIIAGMIKGSPLMQVVIATLAGIPMYTSNLTALPVASGLIDLGLNKGAVLSFLIAGATTTLPAMVAVWGITKKRVFLLYLSYALFGSLLTGMLYNMIN